MTIVKRSSEEYRRGFRAGLEMILSWINNTSDKSCISLKTMILAGLALHDEIQKELPSE
jgi:hypothetical protein